MASRDGSSLTKIGSKMLFIGGETESKGEEDLGGSSTPYGGTPGSGGSGSPKKRPGSRGSTRPGTGSKRPGTANKRRTQVSEFRRVMDTGRLPAAPADCGLGRKLRWGSSTPLESVDLHQYLPLFLDGIREADDGYTFVALQGSLDMIETAGEKIIPIVPLCIAPLKAALNTREPSIVTRGLKILMTLATVHEGSGAALVPHYRALLPSLNIALAKTMARSKKDASLEEEFVPPEELRFGEALMETLETLELTGGTGAGASIKQLVPTYNRVCGGVF